MARPKATEAQRTEIRRGIQKAAAAIYRENGIGGVSARAVATKAGVSVGAIYSHFGDLKTLMQSLWTRHVDRQSEVFQAIADQHTDPADRMSALLTAYLEFGIKNPDLYRNAFMFVRPDNMDKPKALSPETLAFPSLLIQTVRDGQAAGQFVKGAPEEIGQLLWSGLHGCLALPVNFDRLSFAKAEDVAAPMVSALMRAIKA